MTKANSINEFEKAYKETIKEIEDIKRIVESKHLSSLFAVEFHLDPLMAHIVGMREIFIKSVS